MSEKQRYTLTYDDEDCACISEFVDNGKPLTDRAVVDLLNKPNNEISTLKKELKKANEENEKLKQKIIKLEQFEYNETESIELKENKLYIKDTHTELKMEKDKMYISCQIPLNDGTPQIRKHKFGVVGIYHD